MNNQHVTYLFCFVLIALGWSCKKDLDRDNPLDEYNSVNVAENKNDIDSGLVVTSFEIYQDSNGDEIVNKGEFVRLKLNVQNKSLTTVNAVKLTVTSASPYVSNISNYYSVGGFKDVSFGTMEKDKKGDANGLTFDVSNDTPTGTALVFNAVFESEDDQVWTDTFSITTEQNLASIIYHKSSVYSDSNSDGVINKGESIRMNVGVKNVGSSAANDVRISITSNSPYVSSVSNYYSVGGYSGVQYGSLTSNEEYSHDGLSFNVSTTAPEGTVIQFDISVTDTHGNIWNDSFTVTTEALGSNITYNKYSVYTDGNSDGLINKGESIRLNLVVKNTGISTAKGVKVSVTSSNSYVSNISNYYSVGGFTDVSFGDVSANEEVSKNGLSFNVSSNTPNGTVISFNLSMEDQYGNSWSDSFSVTVAATGSILVLSSSQIYSDTNGNGKAEAGESIRMTTYVKNTGMSTAVGSQATITSTSASVSGLGNYYALGGYTAVSYGNLSMNQDKSHSGLKFDIVAGTPVGTIITFNVLLEDQYGNTWNRTFNLTTY